MKYDKSVDLYQREKIPNGIGGFTKEDTLKLTINGYATPIKIQTILSNGMLITKQTIKIFTKDEPTNEVDFSKIDFLKYNGQMYNVVYYADFGKVRMFEVEVVANA